MSKKIGVVFAGMILFLGAFFLEPACSEDMTITTFYPSQYGVHNEIRGINLAIGTNYYDRGQYCWGGGCGTTIDDEADLVVEGRVGIGEVDIPADLTVAGSILSTGTRFTPFPVSGAGRRMLYWPNLSSFRAGEVTGNHWDEVNTGRCSFAAGYDTIASGNFSMAVGHTTTADGQYAVSTGHLSTASGEASMASGLQCQATGFTSFAQGENAVASGDGSKAIGTNVTASGRGSIAMGQDITVSGEASFGIGLDSSTFPYPEVSQDNTMAIIGGRVGIGTLTPGYLLQVGELADGTEAQANAWNTLSDIRLKTNLVRITQALDKIGRINGYYFNWKEGVDKSRQAGMVAQEVEEVLPEIVSTDGKGYKSMDYGKLVPLLVEGIKELKSKNDDLKARIALLKKEVKKD